MNFLLMKSSFPNFVSSSTFQKADGNASGFHKYPRADEIQTRSNPQKNNTSSLNRTRRTLKFECNSKTKLYKSEQELFKQPEFESEPTASKP